MTPDVWADFNQVDGEGHVVAYLEDVVHAERVVVGNVVVVADANNNRVMNFQPVP